MGLIKPSLPDLDYDQWRSQPRREQVRAMVVHWAEQDLDASGATSRAERRTTPVNLRHQPTRSSEDRTVGWSQRRACYLTTEDQDLLAEHDDLDRQLVPFGTAQPAQPAQLKHPHEGHGQPDTRRTMPWPIFPLGWPSAKAQPEVLDGVNRRGLLCRRLAPSGTGQQQDHLRVGHTGQPVPDHHSTSTRAESISI